MRAIAAAAVCIVFVACAGRHPLPEQPAPALSVPSSSSAPTAAPLPTTGDVWQLTLLSVVPLTQRGDFATADSVLATFARGHPGSCEASESGYVRALLRLSPGNTSGKAETAVALLDEYLGSKCLAPSRATEVLMVRKLASDISRHSSVADSASAEEIRKLKLQLEETKKELDRLKMRVIPP